MAASTIWMGPGASGIFQVDQIPVDSRAKTRELLQLNHENYHAIWEVARNLHNHQVHYLLTDLALGASPEQLQKAFDDNTDYMRPVDAGDEHRRHTVTEENFEASLGDEDRYLALMRFFKPLIEQKGWQAVLREFLFSRTRRGDSMLARMFEGRMNHSRYSDLSNSHLNVYIEQERCTEQFILASRSNLKSRLWSQKAWRILLFTEFSAELSSMKLTHWHGQTIH